MIFKGQDHCNTVRIKFQHLEVNRLHKPRVDNRDGMPFRLKFTGDLFRHRNQSTQGKNGYLIVRVML